jgi:glutathione S-transferase
MDKNVAVPLTLYIDAQFLSPYAMSTYVALVEKDLDFEVRQIDLDQGDQRTAPFLHRSPIGKVPVLAHLDFYLSESSAIAEYLEQAFPSPDYRALYPADSRPRALARQIQAWLRSDLHALRRERPTQVIFDAMRPAPLTDAAHCDAARLIRVATALLSHGEGQLFGAWSVADVDLAVMLNRLVFAGDDVPEALRAYAAAQWNHPGIRRWLTSRG